MNPPARIHPSRQARRARKRNRRKRPSQSVDWLVNFLILALSALVVAFIWSFWSRHLNNQVVAEEIARLPAPLPATLPETLSAAKKYPHIKVEILNGCGVSGLAAEFKSLLRAQSFDVQQTGNAPNFNYDTSQIIARSDNIAAAYTLAEELGLDRKVVRIEKDPTLRVDVTLILGKDYRKIPAYKNFR